MVEQAAPTKCGSPRLPPGATIVVQRSNGEKKNRPPLVGTPRRNEFGHRIARRLRIAQVVDEFRARPIALLNAAQNFCSSAPQVQRGLPSPARIVLINAAGTSASKCSPGGISSVRGAECQRLAQPKVNMASVMAMSVTAHHAFHLAFARLKASAELLITARKHRRHVGATSSIGGLRSASAGPSCRSTGPCYKSWINQLPGLVATRAHALWRINR